MSETRGSRTRSFILGALIGAAIGATAALLYTPQKGKDLRRKLKKKGEEIKKEAEKALEGSQSLGSGLKNTWEKVSQIFSEGSPESEEVTNTTEPEGKSQKASKETRPSSLTRAKKMRRFFRGI